MQPRRVLLTGAGLAFAVGFLAYAARSSGPYHFDDWVTPVADPASQSLSAFVSNMTRTLRPVSKLSFAIESSLGLGALPWARRMVSAAMHGASAALLFMVAARLRAGLVAAASVSCLFAVHPIHAEMVWALAGRGALMAVGLSLAALFAQLRGRFWGAGALLALACLCRETAAAFALPLFALELARRREGARELFRRLEPALCVVFLAVAFVLQNARYRDLIDYSAHGRPYVQSVAAQLEAVGIGLSLYVRPGALTLDHGEVLTRQPWSAQTLFGIAVLVGMGGALAIAVRARSALVAVGWAWVLASLLPTQTLIPKLDPLTERPFAAAFVGVALLLVALVRRVRRTAFERRSIQRAAIATSVLACGWLALATWQRGALYASDVELWRDAASKSVTNPRPHYNLSVALLGAGRVSEARQALKRARQIDPFDSEMRGLAARIDPAVASELP